MAGASSLRTPTRVRARAGAQPDSASLCGDKIAAFTKAGHQNRHYLTSTKRFVPEIESNTQGAAFAGYG